MYEPSGEGWIKHFLHGTAQLLQCRGPEAQLTGVGRQFFLTIRVFEVCRALIFTKPTYLGLDVWRDLSAQIWVESKFPDWHPKEALLDLMVSCSALALRAMRVVRADTRLAEEVRESELRATAAEGLHVQRELEAWKTATVSWTMHPHEPLDTQMTLATCFHHAITIFLSGIFDYHSCWLERDIPTPTIGAFEVQVHLYAILTITRFALDQTRLAGILFFFPLRVAGARAKEASHRHSIAGMLHEIFMRGFIVAAAFVDDLDQLWDYRKTQLLRS